jgi:hypothetical protein
VEIKTIDDLRNIPYPAALPPNGRAAEEKHIYEVTTTLCAYRAESDGDYHLVLGNEPENRTIIAEIPKPGDFGSMQSNFADAIYTARVAMDTRFGHQEIITDPTQGGPVAAFAEPGNIPVVITGLCFFDFIHGQRGVAPNGLELHPVIKIDFP